MKLAAVLALALALPSPAPEEPPAAAGLEARFAALAEKADGVVGVSAVEVATGRSAGHDADTRFPMASTYKVPIALAVLHRVDEGALLLSERVEIESGDLTEGGTETVLKRWKPGLALTVRELLDLMITESDNSATDVLLRRIGGPPAVAARLAELGLTGIDVSRSERQSAADAYGVTLPKSPLGLDAFRRLRRAVPAAARRAARDRWEKDPRDTATPSGMARLLVRLAKGELLARPATDLLLDAMGRCKTGDKRIRALLPPGTVVRDKTGTAARSANDVGLVRLPDGRDLAIAIFVKASEKPPQARERTIAEIARAAYDGFVSSGGATPASTSARGPASRARRAARPGPPAP